MGVGAYDVALPWTSAASFGNATLINPSILLMPGADGASAMVVRAARAHRLSEIKTDGYVQYASSNGTINVSEVTTVWHSEIVVATSEWRGVQALSGDNASAWAEALSGDSAPLISAGLTSNVRTQRSWGPLCDGLKCLRTKST